MVDNGDICDTAIPHCLLQTGTSIYKVISMADSQ